MTIDRQESTHETLTIECALQALAEIGEAERHFNQLESQYRLLASTWLLAAFGAIGYVLTADHRAVSVTNIVVLVSFAGSAGIRLLWVLDLLVYHRLLDANFLEGLRLERKFRALPQIRWAMWHQFKAGFGTTTLVRIYYCVCTLAPISAGAYLLLAGSPASVPVYIVAFSGSLAILVLAAILWAKSENPWLAKQVMQLTEGE